MRFASFMTSCVFGMVIVNTPFLKVALTASASMPEGRRWSG